MIMVASESGELTPRNERCAFEEYARLVFVIKK